MNAAELESSLVEVFSSLALTDEIKDACRARLNEETDSAPTEQTKANLSGQLERLTKLFQMGDISEDAYRQERRNLTQRLADLQPVSKTDFDVDAGIELLSQMATALTSVPPEDRKQLYRTVLDEVVVKRHEVVGLRPKPGFYDLIRLSAVRSNGFEPSQPFGH